MRRDTPPRPDVLGELPSLRRYARALTRNDEDAEDLVHDALVRAYERRSSYDERRNLRTWLFSILHNVFVDGRRAAASRATRDERAMMGAPAHADPEQEHVRWRGRGSPG
ncbi:sigma-70 family RNA polymerase sigma factor [Lutibaculum baratangense]|uniref:RNA polymerase sigma-54 factor RpoN n=1 Tax=Lutibaculum baratangense AMV1 TaxID=631454 RepID=V4R1X9_9HYPH|nr:RNA polymerase sigma-54 factor RpoN [Lutibaculum baratangense AMV1]